MEKKIKFKNLFRVFSLTRPLLRNLVSCPMCCSLSGLSPVASGLFGTGRLKGERNVNLNENVECMAANFIVVK